MTHTINFGLLFDEEHNRVFTEYSRSMTSDLKTDFTLGDKSLPHLTVLQYESEERDLMPMWDQLSVLLTKPLLLDLAGLTLLPSKDGHVWVEISVLKKENLALLQARALSIIGDRKVHSGVRDSYRPHITIARVLDCCKFPPVYLDDLVIRRRNVVGRLSLGLSGPNYQYERILCSVK